MIFKTITVEFHEKWGKGFKTFHGWVYYMPKGDSYVFYEILPNKHNHELLATLQKSDIKEIKETFL